jgi:hypothetical protein
MTATVTEASLVTLAFAIFVPAGVVRPRSSFLLVTVKGTVGPLIALRLPEPSGEPGYNFGCEIRSVQSVWMFDNRRSNERGDTGGIGLDQGSLVRVTGSLLQVVSYELVRFLRQFFFDTRLYLSGIHRALSAPWRREVLRNGQ